MLQEFWSWTYFLGPKLEYPSTISFFLLHTVQCIFTGLQWWTSMKKTGVARANVPIWTADLSPRCLGISRKATLPLWYIGFRENLQRKNAVILTRKHGRGTHTHTHFTILRENLVAFPVFQENMVGFPVFPCFASTSSGTSQAPPNCPIGLRLSLPRLVRWGVHRVRLLQVEEVLWVNWAVSTTWFTDVSMGGYPNSWMVYRGCSY